HLHERSLTSDVPSFGGFYIFVTCRLKFYFEWTRLAVARPICSSPVKQAAHGLDVGLSLARPICNLQLPIRVPFGRSPLVAKASGYVVLFPPGPVWRRALWIWVACSCLC